jgi:hypothetical protein
MELIFKYQMGSEENFQLHGFDPGGYSSVDFPDAEETRPTAVNLEALGGNQNAIQGIIHQTLSRHISESLPHKSPLHTNWRKRLREMMIRQNETVMDFLFRPVSEQLTIGPVEQALRRYAQRQDIDVNNVKLLNQILDISGSQIQNEIEECLAKHGTTTSLSSLHSQTQALIELYKETGEKLMSCENQLRARLEKMDRLQKSVSTVIELQSNEGTAGLIASLEEYMKVSFQDMGIEGLYKDVIYLYKKHMVLREAIQFSKVTHQTEPTCPICLVEAVASTIVPCGHTFCGVCVKRMVNECGVCRGKIRERIKIHFT